MKNILKISPQDGGENDNKRRAFDPPIFLCIMGYAINLIGGNTMSKKYTATIELFFNGIECEELNKRIVKHFENKIDDYLRDLDKDDYESANLHMTCFYRRK